MCIDKMMCFDFWGQSKNPIHPRGTTGAVDQGIATSSSAAVRNRRSSRCAAATNCTPIGKPLESTCTGREMAGCPVMLKRGDKGYDLR